MIVELHILQNLAPANLNRDDTGQPKDAIFGGVRRARISSQAWKRAMRTYLQSELPADQLATRTKRAVDLVARRLVAAGETEKDAQIMATGALAAAGISVKEAKSGHLETGALVFLGADEVSALAELAVAERDVLLVKKPDLGPLGKRARETLARSSAVDLALFGRMVAEKPEHNVDGATAVAHALSVNALLAEFDYFTALDDLAGDDESGAAMIESTGFNSSCFYRYLSIDMDHLTKLVGPAHAEEALRVFIAAAVHSMPTGKQRSFGAQNPPSTIFAVARRRGAANLANAFVTPIRPTRDNDLSTAGLAALDAYWGRLGRLYGSDQVVSAAIATLDESALDQLRSVRVDSLAEVTEAMVAATGQGAAA